MKIRVTCFGTTEFTITSGNSPLHQAIRHYIRQFTITSGNSPLHQAIHHYIREFTITSGNSPLHQAIPMLKTLLLYSKVNLN